jgi:hypothetical protein
MRKSGARTLLMGGQACVFYGAAEFSRDLDLLVVVEAENLERLRVGLRGLEAEPIAVPALDGALLERGHAVHFRCRREDVAGLRIDVMSVLRGVAPFEQLWRRRTTLEVDGEEVDLMALPDLVAAKKTQRDKDWPMIRRLVEQSFFGRGAESSAEQVEFWLFELRTSDLLIGAVQEWPAAAARLATQRAAVREALSGGVAGVPSVERALLEEEAEERRKDRAYWEPLKRELEGFRRAVRKSEGPQAAGG